MLEKLVDPKDVIRWKGEIPVGFRYTPGVAGEVFFRELRDRGRLAASRCDACEITYCPPRLFCERCFAELKAAGTVGPRGTLESWSAGRVGVEGEPLPEPVTVGIVRLEGADTVLLHFLTGYGKRSPAIGDRVEVVLKPRARRSGSILDIEGFRPL
ncbi:MAG: Zn-ribbon domain-containing OB-fold protein [Acidobacteria bacterium]|nr:Zn-ribbon domain-containing OB-fold protein [Acidobacteriota bacterium]